MATIDPRKYDPKRLPWEQGDRMCLRRAVRAGLRFAGILHDDAEWVTPHTDSLRELVRRYPVLWYVGQHGTETINTGNRPVLACYDVGKIAPESGLPLYHAVFCSDSDPMERDYKWRIVHLVVGWEELAESRRTTS